MARIPALAFVAGAGLLAAGSAAAETLPFTVAGTGSVGDVLSNELDFTKFNPAMGTLTGVVFDLSSLSSQHATIAISGGEGGNGAAETSVNFLATGPDNGGPITLFSGTGTADANCALFSTPSCPQTDNGAVSNPTFTSPVTVSGALALPFYEGTGTFPVDVNLDSLKFQTTSCFPGDTCTATGSVGWAGDVTVTFQYDATVPEPGTFGLFAAALGGLAMLARRRRARPF